MARTKDEIFDALMTLKDADAILSTILTSASKASFYQSLFTLFSEFGGDFELTFDNFVEEIDAVLVSKQVHNSFWWQRISLEFQLGDSLTIAENGNLVYNPIDETARIVKRAAVITSEVGSITLKIAKLDVDGITPIPLITAESSAFTDYINDMAPAGIVVTIVTVDGDEIKTALNVTVDGQVINVDDGTLLSDGVTKPVEDAIYSYFATFQADDFGGVFYANNLLAEIIAAEGVINANFTTLEKQSANESEYTSILALPGKKFVAFSGYVKNATGYDLSANINYSTE